MQSIFLKVYIPVVTVINAVFFLFLLKDLSKNRRRLREEPGNPVFLAIYNMSVQFLAAFGISDYSIHIIVLRKLKLVQDEYLPGTMLCACIIPQAVMALAYVSSIPVDIPTLAVSITLSILGALFGVRIVSRLEEGTIRLIMGGALLISAALIILGKLDILPTGGDAIGFRSYKLVILGIAAFLLSALNMGGFATTTLLLTILYALGINPLAAFPLSMGSNTFGIVIGGIEFIRRGMYNKKIVFLSSVFGSIGVLLAVFVVKRMDTGILQWVVSIIAVYSGISILAENARKKQKSVTLRSR